MCGERLLLKRRLMKRHDSYVGSRRRGEGARPQTETALADSNVTSHFTPNKSQVELGQKFRLHILQEDQAIRLAEEESS